MPIIFKRRRATDSNKVKKVIGAYLPLSLIEFITLYALDLGASNASIIEEQLNYLKLKKENEGVNLNYLIDSLVQTAKMEYQETVIKNETVNSRTFFIQLKKELSVKDITSEVIEEIIKKVKHATSYETIPGNPVEKTFKRTAY
jgi:signal recognition particle GTPase